MTTTIISSRQPRNVLYHCPDDVKWEQVGVGHYISTDLLPVHLFVCNELVIEPKNYPLLLFAASQRKFREFVEQLVAENNTIYIDYARVANPKITEEVLRMAGRKSRYEKNVEHIFDEYDPEKRLQRPTLEEWLQTLRREHLRQLLPPEQRQEEPTVEELVCQLELELREQLKQALNNQGESN
jgi:hypothetical protein